ncbi:hypothetical protein BpJC7_13230 [Weizmannia acidilactici]|uniref:Uncharacterized protein n=1 Tax=Weizmannia acidilactici TaxID=2607726 RepID=A0A5J4JHK0_9BACI|nr:hypothetical protein BpJC4_17740 [Weizmannia acidilactici]GER70020.1 hypothetical protein BpJC7_13230 [Weizmannia acidilactici]GER74632.1 hypothetical protein BpPP18_26990 [Weizmannia acidilactici]
MIYLFHNPQKEADNSILTYPHVNNNAIEADSSVPVDIFIFPILTGSFKKAKKYTSPRQPFHRRGTELKKAGR